MKTLPSLFLLAAFVAFLVLPLSFEFTGAMLFVAGLAALLVAEYTPRTRLRARAVAAHEVARLTVARSSVLRLAA